MEELLWKGLNNIIAKQGIELWILISSCDDKRSAGIS